MTSFDYFQQAQRTLNKNPKDAQAQFIVDLWNASLNIKQKNEALTAANASLIEQLNAVKAENADYSRKQDMLESRLDKQVTKPFSASAWFAEQEGSVGIPLDTMQ